MWRTECGFQHFEPKIQLVIKLHSDANKEIQKTYPRNQIDLQLIDGCWPEPYNTQPNRFLITNNRILSTSLPVSRYEEFQDSWYGIYAGDVEITNTMPVRDFNCFMSRLCPTRQSWLYQFVRRDLLSSGFISFRMDISRSVFAKQHNNDPYKVFEWQYETWYKNFEAEHQIIKSQVPYCNFDDQADLNHLIMQSKFSIVLETYFERNEIITLSEKIFRQLKLPRPWLLFAMKHAVKYLRDIGFDVLDDIVDHSYDNIDFDIARQVEILNQMSALSNLTFNQSLVSRLEKAARHNQQLLQSLLNRFDQETTESFANAIKKITHV